MVYIWYDKIKVAIYIGTLNSTISSYFFIASTVNSDLKTVSTIPMLSWKWFDDCKYDWFCATVGSTPSYSLSSAFSVFDTNGRAYLLHHSSDNYHFQRPAL